MISSNFELLQLKLLQLSLLSWRVCTVGGVGEGTAPPLFACVHEWHPFCVHPTNTPPKSCTSYCQTEQISSVCINAITKKIRLVASQNITVCILTTSLRVWNALALHIPYLAIFFLI